MKTRARWLIVFATALLLTMLVLLPRITEAGRSKWLASRDYSVGEPDV